MDKGTAEGGKHMKCAGVPWCRLRALPMILQEESQLPVNGFAAR